MINTAGKNLRNLGYFLLKKVPKLDNFRVKFVNFRVKRSFWMFVTMNTIVTLRPCSVNSIN